ncbi:MAG TPA: hypothetical protein VGI74_21115 [Streptosporangiaceae bacterium]
MTVLVLACDDDSVAEVQLAAATPAHSVLAEAMPSGEKPSPAPPSTACQVVTA